MILCNKSDLARTTEKKHMFEWILSYILEMKKKKPRLTGGGGGGLNKSEIIRQ